MLHKKARISDNIREDTAGPDLTNARAGPVSSLVSTIPLSIYHDICRPIFTKDPNQARSISTLPSVTCNIATTISKVNYVLLKFYQIIRHAARSIH